MWALIINYLLKKKKNENGILKNACDNQGSCDSEARQQPINLFQYSNAGHIWIKRVSLPANENQKDNYTYNKEVRFENE